MKTAQIEVQYMDHMGSDLTVVNAARASFDKESEWLDAYVSADEYTQTGVLMSRTLKPADANLIGFLARGYRTNEWDALADTFLLAESRSQVQAMLRHYKQHAQHWAPFAHPHIQLRLSMPVFAARQYVKHQIGGTWSEVSRRYVSDEPEFWFPTEWHSRPEDVKQGSGDLVPSQAFVDSEARLAAERALQAYLTLMRNGVAPEEARIVLTLNHMTTVVWTGSLLFWARVCQQRMDGHAQKAATQEIAHKINDIIAPLYPVSWKELVG